MGASTSTLTPEEITELQEVSHFSAHEIKKLYRRFCKLDRGNRGVLTTNDLQLIPELSMNPLCHRIISVMEQNGVVNFAAFVQALSVFADTAPENKKFVFAFQIYDVDGDGCISEQDLFPVLKLMCGTHISDEELKLIVADTIQQADRDGDGKINFEEFKSVMKDVDLTSQMTIKFF
eukprot:TRINITY_DN21236_c0_g1_i1.p1 TRINITY_DN21236_c0_g1~~TRINITY_DN21236_c0_g1_i1.p1  ORF type:complete len:194 (+),score=74.64 TRINITY_DN21236_c0_g1_i1:53-583(+)